MKVLTLVGLLIASPAFAQLEGYGTTATGGAGGQTCLVNNLLPTGPNSFSDCARRGNVIVQFDSPGPYAVDGENTYLKSNTTIDGCANGQNGVTLNQAAVINGVGKHRAIVVEGPASNFIFKCLRLQGGSKIDASSIEFDNLGLDGTGGAISKVMIDRVTSIQATDGALDMTGDVSDMTVQRSLFYANPITMLIKYGARKRISIHHNVLTGNCERNPQIRGDMDGFDFVSNVVGPQANPPLVDGENGRAWTDCYGLRLHASTTDSIGNPKGNAVNNAFFGQEPIQLIVDSGATLAGVYLHDNQYLGAPWPGYTWPGNLGALAYQIPGYAVVTHTTVENLKATLPGVGSPNRTPGDQAKIDAVAAALPGPNPEPTPTPTPTPTPAPTPTPCPICQQVQVISSSCGGRVTYTRLSDGSLRITLRQGGATCSVVVK